jgi:hypothetical protein
MNFALDAGVANGETDRIVEDLIPPDQPGNPIHDGQQPNGPGDIAYQDSETGNSYQPDKNGTTDDSPLQDDVVGDGEEIYERPDSDAFRDQSSVRVWCRSMTPAIPFDLMIRYRQRTQVWRATFLFRQFDFGLNTHDNRIGRIALDIVPVYSPGMVVYQSAWFRVGLDPAKRSQEAQIKIDVNQPSLHLPALCRIKRPQQD